MQLDGLMTFWNVWEKWWIMHRGAIIVLSEVQSILPYVNAMNEKRSLFFQCSHVLMHCVYTMHWHTYVCCHIYLISFMRTSIYRLRITAVRFSMSIKYNYIFSHCWKCPNNAGLGLPNIVLCTYLMTYTHSHNSVAPFESRFPGICLWIAKWKCSW